MEYLNIIITICTAAGTIFTLVSFLGKRFDKVDARFDRIETELKHQGQRISRIEGYLSGRDSNKTGT